MKDSEARENIEGLVRWFRLLSERVTGCDANYIELLGKYTELAGYKHSHPEWCVDKWDRDAKPVDIDDVVRLLLDYLGLEVKTHNISAYLEKKVEDEV